MLRNLLLSCCMVVSSTAAVAANEHTALQAPVLNLPTGPGSISGLGEAFTPNLNTGTSSRLVNLAVPPGRNGLAPDVSLEYNSGFGNGLLGLGHKLVIPYIQRQTDKGLPNYSEWGQADRQDNDRDGRTDEFDEFDTFINHLGEELVLVEDGVYRTKNASDFARYERLSKGWLVTQSNGLRWYLGQDSNSRVSGNNGTSVFSWYLEAVEDTHGNRIDYQYRKLDDGVQIYLDRIQYNTNGDMAVQFHYEDRPDVLTNYKAGFEIKTAYRLQRVETQFAGRHLRKYEFSYQPLTEWQSLSLLQEVHSSAGEGESTVTLPPVRYGYTHYQQDQVFMSPMPAASQVPLNNPDVAFLDINRDGLPDVVNTAPNKDVYWLNLGPDKDGLPQWQSYREMNTFTTSRISSDSVTWADIDGAGDVNLLQYSSGSTHYFHLDDNYSWQYSGAIDGLYIPLDSPHVDMLDINNDKRIDVFATITNSSGKVLSHVVQLNHPDGWSQPIQLPMPTGTAAMRLGDPNVFLRDMNGDGLPDLVWVSNGYAAYYANRGLQGFAPAVVFANSPDTLHNLKNVRVTDINADGRADLVYLNGTHVSIWLNQGLNSNQHQLAQFSQPQLIQAQGNVAPEEVRLVDINGNGSTDIVWYSPGRGANTFYFAELFPNEQPNQLKTIDNGLGALTTLEYGSVVEEMVRDREGNSPWSQGIPVAMQVLKRVIVDDGRGGEQQTTEMDYWDGFYDAADKEFQGFAHSEERRVGDASTPTLATRYEFHLGQKADGTEQEALQGKIKQIETRDAFGGIFWREENQWELRQLLSGYAEESRKVEFAAMTERQQHMLERGSGTPVTLAWEYDYDNYGNTTYIKELGRTDGNWQDERITQLRFSAESASAQGHWFLHLPLERKVTDLSGRAVAKEQWFYDDESFSAGNLGAVSKGNLTLRRLWHDAESADAYVAAERHRYDAFGNRIQSYDPLWDANTGHQTKVTYDSQYHTFPTEVGLHTGSRWLTARAGYDKGLGVLTDYTDFNGQQTQYGYDSHGRLTAMAKPGDSLQLPTVEYDYQLAQMVDGHRISWVETRQRERSGASGTIDSRRFYDGLGRTLMVRSEAEQPGQVVVSDHSNFNARGQVVQTALPYFAQGLAYRANDKGQHHRQYLYDAQGRTQEVYQPYTAQSGESVFNRITYLPMAQVLEDEEQTRANSVHHGAAKKLVFDGLQTAQGEYRLRQVDEIVGANTQGGIGGATWSTYYDYDLNGNFTRLQDAQNNVRTMHYDDLGRMRFLDDPNRGQRWQYFDDAGNLLATRDALGQERHYRYDGANRLFAEYQLSPRGEAPSGANWQPGLQLGSTSPVVSYQYDQRGEEGGAFLLGRLAKVTDQAGFEQWVYDARGRVVQRQRKIIGPQINSPLYTTRFAYDSAGRMTQQFYPDNSRVNFEYNTRGLLERIPGVVERLDYTANGVLQHQGLANGVETDWGFDERQRLAGLRTQRSGDALPLQQWDYRFDAVSNVLGIDDKRPSDALAAMAAELGATSAQAASLAKNIVYSYDDVYRLTGVADDIEQVYYSYDKIGNLLQVGRASVDLADMATAGNTQITDLRYGGSHDNGNTGASNRSSRGSLPGPQALSWAEGLIEYDDNGNRTQAGDQTYHWDHDQRLTYAGNKQAADQYGYDFKHQRRFKITERTGGARSVTLYIDGDSEVRDGKLLKYISVGQKRIARSDQSGEVFTPTEYYLHTHVGSTDLTLDKAGKIINAFTYKSYGELENVFGDSTAAPYRYAGKELDESTGLGYFERRYLQSDFGTFISPDPVLNHSGRFTDPQRWTPYRYARNNPINYVDPNGETAIRQYNQSNNSSAQVSSGMSVSYSSGNGVARDGSSGGGSKGTHGALKNNSQNLGNGLHKNLKVGQEASEKGLHENLEMGPKEVEKKQITRPKQCGAGVVTCKANGTGGATTPPDHPRWPGTGYTKDGRKIALYTCSNSGGQCSFHAPSGGKNVYGAVLETTVTRSGDLSTHATGLKSFTVDPSPGFLEEYFGVKPSDFVEELRANQKVQ
ncbi:FG-GAP-like repeat-containing protein [Microbulbifer variabilis]|uniref:FG-GAP-like repeat-containing protein n=1 Tax=Microbulbifer variabilis TaxID=266805 RepID=A0ABY4V9Q8_9GAMM|nr:toxin TcdB middle/N-terminal domain-containing protein [Microbulbifer variabilis]USD21026.1 FG-GAP-like repeat-containing protein [Microbulbifer variabilis]